jgi:hypothetical protein
MWATGQSDGALDSHCSLSGAPSGTCSDSTRAVALFTVHCRLLQTTVGAFSHCSAGTPDSSVLHRTVRWIIAEWLPKFPKVSSSEWFSLVHRTLSGGTPDSPVRQTRATFGCLLLFLFEPFLGLFIGLCWTFGTCRTYSLEQTSYSNYLCWAIQPPKLFRKRCEPISLSISPFLVIDANTNQSNYISAELN